jgi:hypothetical protein
MWRCRVSPRIEHPVGHIWAPTVDETIRCLEREDLALVRRIFLISPTVSLELEELFEHRTDQRSSTEDWPID